MFNPDQRPNKSNHDFLEIAIILFVCILSIILAWSTIFSTRKDTTPLAAAVTGVVLVLSNTAFQFAGVLHNERNVLSRQKLTNAGCHYLIASLILLAVLMVKACYSYVNAHEIGLKMQDGESETLTGIAALLGTVVGGLFVAIGTGELVSGILNRRCENLRRIVSGLTDPDIGSSDRSIP